MRTSYSPNACNDSENMPTHTPPLRHFQTILLRPNPPPRLFHSWAHTTLLTKCTIPASWLRQRLQGPTMATAPTSHTAQRGERAAPALGRRLQRSKPASPTSSRPHPVSLRQTCTYAQQQSKGVELRPRRLPEENEQERTPAALPQTHAQCVLRGVCSPRCLTGDCEQPTCLPAPLIQTHTRMSRSRRFTSRHSRRF